ncbi:MULTISPECIES: hypothetical protein [Psychrobacter]|uniref:hypothetical protein n=1 Tax=Psychrobacter TaxID=497 RepID=UPI00097F0272|nr:MULTISPECIES: hypothetical protein [Psychrobacter]SJN15501.1 hypothetical protein CZ794_00325 [Psychrobacter sp. JB385]
MLDDPVLSTASVSTESLLLSTDDSKEQPLIGNASKILNGKEAKTVARLHIEWVVKSVINCYPAVFF